MGRGRGPRLFMTTVAGGTPGGDWANSAQASSMISIHSRIVKSFSTSSFDRIAEPVGPHLRRNADELRLAVELNVARIIAANSAIVLHSCERAIQRFTPQ